MKWFRHFSNAHDNNNLTKVRMRYGAEGYAIYWYCLELIAGDLGTKDDITFELKHDVEVIGFNLKIDSVKVQEIMLYMIELNLFENIEGSVTCLKLAKYLDKKNTRNSDIHRIVDAANMSATIPDSPPTLPDKSGHSPLELELELDSKNNGAKTSVSDQFESFWKAWPKKLGEKGEKKPAKAQFLKINPSQETFISITNAVSRQTALKQYKREAKEFCPNFPHVKKWLRDEAWENEVEEFNYPEEVSYL